MDDYATFCFENLETVLADDSTIADFVVAWSNKIQEKFPDIKSSEIQALYAKGDTHNSNERVREFWKYSTSIGVSGTPTGFINGVKMTSLPNTYQDWLDLCMTLKCHAN